MDYLSFSIGMPVRAGKGALWISDGNYVQPGRALDEYELIFVRKGILRVQESATSFDVGRGQTVVFAPGVYHQCREISDEPLKYYWVRFKISDSLNQMSHTEMIVPRVSIIKSPDYSLHLWQMYLEQNMLDPTGQYAADLAVTLLLCEIAQAGKVIDELACTATALASQARIYIQEHFAEQISTSSIASALDCNHNYLGRSFRKACGMTISDYLSSVRVSYARDILVYGRQSITDIARLCRFGNLSHFRQTFLKREGMSPLAYRKRHGQIKTNL